MGLQILKLDSSVDLSQHCKFKVKEITFYLVYRSPSSLAAETTRLAELIRRAEKDSVFIGDFNLPGINWENGTATGAGREVLEATEDMLMSQLVDFSTQVKGNVLDLVLTNMPDRVLDVKEEGRLGRSDHCIRVDRFSFFYEF